MMRRALGLALLSLGVAVPAVAAGPTDKDGYRYVHISLDGLWGGFFFFLVGISFCLIGLYLFIAWRKGNRRNSADQAARERAEDDGQVF